MQRKVAQAAVYCNSSFAKRRAPPAEQAAASRKARTVPITDRQGRMGAGLAGGLLLAISLADWALGTENPDAVNLITGILGAALLAWAIAARRRISGRRSSRENRR